jgi:hypothetical protein
MQTRHLLAIAALSCVACGGTAPPLAQLPAVATSSAPARVASVTSLPPAQASTVKRVLVSLSRPSGTCVTTTASDGTVTIVFDVKLNGRGPHVDATLRLGADGTIASLEARGHHDLGAIVEETFARDGNHVRWRSREESGERELSGSAFFVPIAEIPDTTGYLAQALLKAGGSMPLLPRGQARIDKTGEATVRAGDQQKHLTSYAITGLELTPLNVWMNDDGSWFGFVYPWWSVVPQGWEGAVEALQQKQDQIDRQRDARNAQAYAHKPPPEGIAYIHARVLDVERGSWRSDQSVIVVGDSIKFVGPSATAKIPKGAEQVDLTGKALLPGLWDMHTHAGDPDGALHIASGVTTIREVGGDPDKNDDFKKRYDEGTAIGPHMLRYGFIEGRGEKACSSKVTAETEAEARAAVEFFAKRGYEGIKIYNSIKPELVPILAKEAHARGMGVTGHVPVHMLANEVVRAGYDGIEHVNMLFLNFLANHDTDTRTTARFQIVADQGATLDLASKPVQEFFELLRNNKTVITPTLVAFEDLIKGEQGKVAEGSEWMIERLPVQTQRVFLTGGLPGAEANRQVHGDSWTKALAMVKALRDAKVRVVVGTDMLSGLELHHELELLVRAGISPADALRMATIEPARWMKRDKQSGSIAVGKTADMFVVDGDPLARISDARNVLSTMRAGVVFPSKEVYATVGVSAPKAGK